MTLPKTFTAGERLFAADLNDNFGYFDEQLPTATEGQVLTYNATSGKWEAKDLKMKEKRIAAFTGSGTWTVPAEVTYAIAHMLGGGGGTGTASAGNGANSSVAFTSGTLSAAGGLGFNASINQAIQARAGVANSGQGAIISGRAADPFSDNTVFGRGNAEGGNGAHVVAAAAVTPAESITVTVGAGGAAGTSGAAGGSGYVFIEYYEEV
jgi:hypothetical protein